MASRLAGAAPPTRNFTNILPPVNGGIWYLLRPPREHFSVLVPKEGEEKSVPMRDGDDGHLYRARDGRSAFVVSWFFGVTYGESDVDAIRHSLAGFFKGLGASLDAMSSGQAAGFSCELQNEKDVSMGDFTGLEFDLPSCTIPAKARVFTRIINGNRQMYLATVFYMEQDDNVSRFINSFKITPAKPQKSTKVTK
jgi:hypothetical protein